MKNINQELNTIHSYLMWKKFPYQSVSVIHRGQDIGFCVFFTESVKPMVTEDVRSHLEANDFKIIFSPNV